MIPDSWIDEEALELLKSADFYYLILLSTSLVPALIILRLLIEIGFEFFANN